MKVQEAIEMMQGYQATDTVDRAEWDTFQMAIEAMEKQIPKKPKNIIFKDEFMTTIYECPICKCRRLGHGFDLDKCYCPECGQKLDWEL